MTYCLLIHSQSVRFHNLVSACAMGHPISRKVLAIGRKVVSLPSDTKSATRELLKYLTLNFIFCASPYSLHASIESLSACGGNTNFSVGYLGMVHFRKNDSMFCVAN